MIRRHRRGRLPRAGGAARRWRPRPGAVVAWLRRGRRFTLRDLLDEALAGVTARPARLALLTLGTVLGIGAVVTTLGIGQTAAGQIAQRFDAVAATHIVIEPSEAQRGERSVRFGQLPWDAPQRVERLNGVVAAGTYARVDVGDATVRGIPVNDPGSAVTHSVPVIGASPHLFQAVYGDLRTGRGFDSGHDERADPVVVLGRYAAQRLGVNRIDSQPSIFIGERAFTVIGILERVSYRSDLLDAAVIPMGTAREIYGLAGPDSVEIRTVVGATQLIAGQAPIAIDPNNPDRLRVNAPPPPGQLRRDVAADVNALFLVLGGIALLIGGLGIANVTLLSVLERIPEIGLRRALGATRVHIAGQFLVESVFVGFLGGLIGTSLAVIVTVVVSAVRDWTPILDLRLAVGAPLAGALIGLVAGGYPAWRAAAIEPITALRSG